MEDSSKFLCAIQIVMPEIDMDWYKLQCTFHLSDINAASLRLSHLTCLAKIMDTSRHLLLLPGRPSRVKDRHQKGEGSPLCLLKPPEQLLRIKVCP